ncbi:MAG: PAS domain-containing hybrid sensor histidine kinase/response regulator [Fidelibacterota bacterium]
MLVFRDQTEERQAQKALQESEERYRMMLEQAADAVFLHDETGRILDVNQKACQNLGYTREELLTKSIVDIDPEAIEAGKSEFWSKVLAGEHFTFESHHLRKDGSIFPVEITMGSVQLSSGPAALCIVRDVSERRRTEEQIHFQANLLQNVFDAIIASDTDDRIQVWNKAAERIYGWKTKDVVGQKFHDVLRPEYFYQSREKVMASINKDGIWSGEIIHHNKDGKIIHIQSTISSLKDTAGNFTGLVSINHDITEKKQAEEALRESERFLKAIFTSIQDGISVLNPDLTIRYVNDVMNEWYSENLPLEGKKCFEVYRNKDVPCDTCPSIQCMKSGKTEFTIVPGLPGSPVEWIELFSFPIKAQNSNEVTGVVEFLRDITDRKRAEVEKESLEAQLRQSQKLESIGTLASGVAHDFNNLLTVIMGHAQMALMQTDKGDPLHRSLKQIIDSSTRAADLTRQLLLFSRKEAMEFKPVNLNHTINNLLKMLGRLIGENISIETILTADVWNVEADEGNIEQVLINLAVNARDAMPNGGKLFIQTENVEITESDKKHILHAEVGNYVRIGVSDNGEGIPGDIRDKIFDPFFSTKETGKGTGLGLSVVYGIVKKHRGWINVYSEVGKGTRFSIYLPATTISEKSDREAYFSIGESLYGNGEHILLIEDERGVLDMALDALQNYNYIVHTASSGKQAEEVYQKEEGNFDLIFSDVVLPDTNGYELVHLLTRNDPDMSIILSSGYTDEQIRKTIGKDKKILFIQKPFSVNALLELVKKSLKNRTKNLK